LAGSSRVLRCSSTALQQCLRPAIFVAVPAQLRE
jgi:hypothetical protein